MDIINYSQFILAVLILVSLLGAFAIGMRKLSNSRVWEQLAAQRNKRLKVIETLAIDPKRRLVLIRADHREHLLLVGGTTDVVIQADILALRGSVPPSRLENSPSATSQEPGGST